MGRTLITFFCIYFLYIWSLLGDAEFGSGHVGVLEGETGGWGVGLRNKEGVGKLFHCA